MRAASAWLCIGCWQNLACAVRDGDGLYWRLGGNGVLQVLTPLGGCTAFRKTCNLSPLFDERNGRRRRLQRATQRLAIGNRNHRRTASEHAPRRHMVSGNRVASRQRQGSHDVAPTGTTTQKNQRQPQVQHRDHQQEEAMASQCNVQETNSRGKRKMTSTPTKPKEPRAQRDAATELNRADTNQERSQDEKQPRRATGSVAERRGTSSRHETPPLPQVNVAASTDEAIPTPQDSPSDMNSPGFSWDDILRVQNLIERCLQQFLSKDEIVSTLSSQAKVDPEFTRVVWQKLEIQNPTFFKAYAIQLQLKEQILAFNYLVKQQKEMMAKLEGFSVYASSSGASNATSLNLPSIQVDSQYFVTKSVDTPLGSSSIMDFAASAFAVGSASLAGSDLLSSALNATATAAAADSVTGTTTATTSLVGSTFPLPSPIKTDLDTHAFFS